MNVDEFFGKLVSEYNVEWFEKGQELFRNHPSNQEGSDVFKAYELDYTNEKAWSKEFDMTLFEFLMGKRDDSYDEIHDELQEENLETIGFDESDAHIIREKEGKRYFSSTSLYPSPNLSQWRFGFEKEYKACLSLLSTLEEKDKFNSYVLLLIHILKKQVSEVANIDYKSNMLVFIEDLEKGVHERNHRISFLQDMIGDYSFALRLNLRQAQLVEFISSWRQKGIIDQNLSDQEVCGFFIRSVLVKNNKDQFVEPKTLYAAYRRLVSQKSSIKRRKGGSMH